MEILEVYMPIFEKYFIIIILFGKILEKNSFVGKLIHFVWEIIFP